MENIWQKLGCSLPRVVFNYQGISADIVEKSPNADYSQDLSSMM
ncbi:MAG: hypothetical protein ABH886_09145 [Candidatus Desantisbacteria bacterium]